MAAGERKKQFRIVGDLPGPNSHLQPPNLPPLAHLLRMPIQPALHLLQNVLMLPSGDRSLFARGAAVLNGAALADICLIAA